MNASTYTLKFYKGRKLIAETSFDSPNYEHGDGELTPTLAGQIANESAQIIQEAIDCNPPEGALL